jgi:Flp pilus assembly CpaF family ATPase
MDGASKQTLYSSSDTFYLGGVAKRPSVMSNEMKRLYDLLRSGLHPLSAELGTSCAVLLSGARGSGKRTTVAWVTQMLGLHLLEASRIWSIDNDHKLTDHHE